MFYAVKTGNIYCYNYKEFVCDTAADLASIETELLAIGSRATVLNGQDGNQIYILNGKREWVEDTVNEDRIVSDVLAALPKWEDEEY